MPDPLAAAIAFVALGANLLGAGLLLLFNPRSRGVRWFALFEGVLLVWLLAQGIAFARGAWGAWEYAYAAAVTALPGLFLAASLMDDPRRPGWQALPPLVVTMVMVPVGIRAMTGDAPRAFDLAVLAWHVLGWGGGSVAHALQRHQGGGAQATLDRLVTRALLFAAPVSVAAAFIVGAYDFFIYAMPLVTVLIQGLIFYGVRSMQFYDIEVQAARTGDLAAQAATTERLAVVGELAASLAHEVRNPLAGMRSLAQRMAEEQLDDDRRRRYAGVILEESGRVERIVDNLLTLARKRLPREWSPGPTPLAPLFEDLALLTEARAERAGVELRTDARRLAAHVPREALAQAVLNLLLNALDHAPEGSAVALEARPRDDSVEIAVRDWGPGIPAEERDRIFEPFHSTGTDGAGLGLSVVRTLARELDWTVEVADVEGSGTELRLVVPAVGPPEPGVSGLPAESTPGAEAS